MTYWLVGATDNAIQRKPVDIGDLPPPLFCRPRRSPKLNSESRQPSLMGMGVFGAYILYMKVFEKCFLFDYFIFIRSRKSATIKCSTD